MRNGPYIMVVAPPEYPGKKYRGKYVYEHTLTWWKHTGTVPVPGEVVHHKNEDKHDNRIDNLEKKTGTQHTKEHALESPAPLQEISCSRCARLFTIFERTVRWKRRKGQERFYCSRSCQVSAQQLEIKRQRRGDGLGWVRRQNVERAKEAIRLHLAGRSNTSISEELGCTMRTVRKWIDGYSRVP